MSEGAPRRLALTAIAFALAQPACHSAAHDEPVAVGVLLSYSGFLAANSINSERALLMAIDAANRAGGINGRPLEVKARDTGSDLTKVTPRAQELMDAGASILIGPDTPELAVELKATFSGQTMIMPSFATSSNFSKPYSWFVMGPPAVRVACELHEQYTRDGRSNPLLIVAPTGYNALLGWEIIRKYAVPSVVLPSDESTNEMVVPRIMAARADAYLLAALPPSASSLFFALAAQGALADPTEWYLSPTLHSPALLETIPKGLLRGARGVAAGTVAGAHDFYEAFRARWQDTPLDDAYSFYDAAAVAVLALQRAVTKQGSIPPGNGLDAHIMAVTHSSGTRVKWNELGVGLQLLQADPTAEVSYTGLSGGPLDFDLAGQSNTASTAWWTIGEAGFESLVKTGGCNADTR